MAPPEKLRREADDVEACSPPRAVEFTRTSKRRRRWKAGLLLASLLAATAVVFAVVGLVTGLGVVRSGSSGRSDDGCSAPSAVGGDPTASVSTTRTLAMHGSAAVAVH